MPRQCHRIQLPDGTWAIVTMSAPRNPTGPCAFCRNVYAKLCDFPLRGKRAGRTCSKRICNQCATQFGDNLDLCPIHLKVIKETGVATVSEQLARLLSDPNKSGHAVALDLIDQHVVVPGAPRAKPRKFRDLADWREFVTERAAIGEYVGELARADAEKQALAEAGARPK